MQTPASTSSCCVVPDSMRRAPICRRARLAGRIRLCRGWKPALRTGLSRASTFNSSSRSIASTMNRKNEMLPVPYRQIRASFTDTTIRVYQAFSDAIAEPALAAGTFRPPFKLERMTWIKPSFLWMMYRAGWGYKDAGQSRILAVDMLRSGFDWALQHAALSTHGALDPAEW